MGDLRTTSVGVEVAGSASPGKLRTTFVGVEIAVDWPGTADDPLDTTPTPGHATQALVESAVEEDNPEEVVTQTLVESSLEEADPLTSITQTLAEGSLEEIDPERFVTQTLIEVALLPCPPIQEELYDLTITIEEDVENAIIRVLTTQPPFASDRVRYVLYANNGGDVTLVADSGWVPWNGPVEFTGVTLIQCYIVRFLVMDECGQQLESHSSIRLVDEAAGEDFYPDCPETPDTTSWSDC